MVRTHEHHNMYVLPDREGRVAGGFHLLVIMIVVFHHNEGTGGADTDPPTWLYPVGRASTECLAKLVYQNKDPMRTRLVLVGIVIYL